MKTRIGTFASWYKLVCTWVFLVAVLFYYLIADGLDGYKRVLEQSIGLKCQFERSEVC